MISLALFAAPLTSLWLAPRLLAIREWLLVCPFCHFTLAALESGFLLARQFSIRKSHFSSFLSCSSFQSVIFHSSPFDSVYPSVSLIFSSLQLSSHRLSNFIWLIDWFVLSLMQKKTNHVVFSCPALFCDELSFPTPRLTNLPFPSIRPPDNPLTSLLLTLTALLFKLYSFFQLSIVSPLTSNHKLFSLNFFVNST